MIFHEKLSFLHVPPFPPPQIQHLLNSFTEISEKSKRKLSETEHLLCYRCDFLRIEELQTDAGTTRAQICLRLCTFAFAALQREVLLLRGLRRQEHHQQVRLSCCQLPLDSSQIQL